MPVKPHAVTQVGSTTYQYDANGNMTYRGSHNLTWSVENQLSSYNDGSATTTFVYDGNGQRGKKTVGGTTTTLYVNKYYEKNLSFRYCTFADEMRITVKCAIK